MSSQLSLIDIHCHIHDLDSVGSFLKKAHTNFVNNARILGLDGHWDAFLFCADLQGKDRQSVLAAIDAASSHEVRIAKTEEAHSRIITVPGSSTRMFLVMGYQIICEGDLEVLAYGLHHPIADGLGVDDTINRTLDQQALAILPWGFGKWMFKRGQVIDSALDQIHRSDFHKGRVFVADNGGRVFWAWEPALIKKADSLGIWNLVGSDPLPFPAQAAKAGDTGNFMIVNINTARPLRSVQKALAELPSQHRTYGSGENLLTFVIAQIRMQMQKRLRRAERE